MPLAPPLPAGLLAPSIASDHVHVLPLAREAKGHDVRVRARAGAELSSRTWGKVDRLAFSDERNVLALAHSSSRLTLVALPSPDAPKPTPPALAVEGEGAPAAPSRPELEIIQEWATSSTIKAANRTIALDFLSSGLLHATSAGHLALHAFPPSSSSSSTAPAVQKRRLPANLTCFTALGSQGERFAYAGHEVDLSLWDTERAFAADSSKAPKKDAAAGGKRKKNAVDLLDGEVWRAKNVPNDYLQLRVPIHHLSLTAATSGSTTQLYTGTYSGQVRLYDTRASRRPVQTHEVLKPFPNTGVGALAIAAGEEIESPASDVWFAEDGRGQGRVGRIDARTGRVLYFHSETSATSSALFAGPDFVGALGADHTLSAYDVPASESDSKRTPQRGSLIGRSFGASGRSLAYLPSTLVEVLLPAAVPVEGEDGDEADSEEDDEQVWDALPELKDGERAELDSDDEASGEEVHVDGEESSDEDNGWSSDEEKKKPAAKKGKPKQSGAKKARR